MRTTLVFLLALALMLGGCGKAELENQNKELQKQLQAKDQYIEEVTSAINEIHNQLENTWAMEKNVMQQSTAREGSKPATNVEMKQRIISRIADIDSILSANRKKLSGLQNKLKAAAVQYAGLQKMVEDLKATLEEREKALTDLQERVKTLEGVVTEKTRIIAARETTIEEQSSELKERTKRMNTVYVVVGKRDDLKTKGIIADEGGVLWGLLGSTTVLASNFNSELFQQLDKTKDMQIDVTGKIDEIIPKRETAAYALEPAAGGHTILKIVNPDQFWKVNRIVVISK